MSIFSSYKKIFLLGFIIMILVTIPIFVFVAQQSQQTKSKATASTVLSFEPAVTTVRVGDIVTLNIMLDPGTGTSANQVSFVKLSIHFSASKFTTLSDSLIPNPDSPNTLTTVVDDPKYDNTAGKASISLSVGADPTRVVTAKTKIAILKLKAIDEDNRIAPTVPNITFDPVPDTQVLSIASSDQTSENVLSTTIPATVTINPASSAAGTATPTPTLIPTPTPTPTANAGPPASGGGTGLGSGTGTIAAGLIPTVVTPTPQPLPTTVALPPTGPENILTIGAIGAIFTLVGGALLIFL